MREIILTYNDHSVFDTNFAPEQLSFILNHIDAFKRMWNEQGKSFWCKVLTMYRHHCYNIGTVHCLSADSAKMPHMSLKCLSILADQVFIVLYDEFVNCRYSAAKDLINDLATLIANKNLLLACHNTSISSNPFYIGEARDAFRKLLGHWKSFPPLMKGYYYFCVAYPIYSIFGGGIYHILKRWLRAKDVTMAPDKYLDICWEPPTDLLNECIFEPYPYHRHLVEVHGSQVDKMLRHGCFGLFSSNRSSPSGGLDEGVKDQPLDTTHHLFETFVEFMSQREWFPNEKYDSNELRLDFEEYVRDKQDDYDDEEFRRSMVLQLAEEKFKKELAEEDIKTTKIPESSQYVQTNSKTSVQKSIKATTTKPASTSSTQTTTTPSKTEADIEKKQSVFTQTEPPNVKSKSASGSSSDQKNNIKNINHKCNSTYTPSSASSDSSVAPKGKKNKKKKKKNTNENGCSVQMEFMTKGEALGLPGIKITKTCECHHQSETTGGSTKTTTGSGKGVDDSKKGAGNSKIGTGNCKKSTGDCTLGAGDCKKSTANIKKATTDSKNSTVETTASKNTRSTLDTKKGAADSKTVTANSKNGTGDNLKGIADKIKTVADSMKSTDDSTKSTVGSKKTTAGQSPSSISNQNQGIKKDIARNVSSTGVASSPTTSKGSAAELKVINNNITSIQQSVKEQNSLSLDGFRLMVETGKLLMGGNTSADDKDSLHSCAQCTNKEQVAKSFKKCGRCKVENIKWARYYCSRECQVEAWGQCHQEEHVKGLLVVKK